MTSGPRNLCLKAHLVNLYLSQEFYKRKTDTGKDTIWISDNKSIAGRADVYQVGQTIGRTQD